MRFISGAWELNQGIFDNELVKRMGFEEAAERVQDLYLAGKKDEAMLAVPSELADEISLVGSVDRIKDAECLEETPVFILVGIYKESWRTANVRSRVLLNIRVNVSCRPNSLE